MINSFLVQGDPLNPGETDLIAQTVDLPLGEAPYGLGWTILTGNALTNFWTRLVFRLDTEEKS